MYGTGTILRHSFILDYYKQKQLKNENIHIKTVPISKIAKDGIKVLGNGNLEKAVTVKAAKFTASAQEKIEKAGGKAELV